MTTSMSTPITNLPLKTQQNIDTNELQDPLVQDILKEFEEEVAAAKKQIPQQSQPQVQPPVQPQPQPQPQVQQQMQPQYIQLQKNNLWDKYINIDKIRVAIIITIIALSVLYTGILDSIFSKLQ